MSLTKFRRNEELVAMLHEGKTYQEIADHFNISRARVGELAKINHWVGNKNRPRRPNAKSLALANLDWEHKTLTELAGETGIKYGALSRYAGRNNIKILKEYEKRALGHVCTKIYAKGMCFTCYRKDLRKRHLQGDEVRKYIK
jgi:transposase